MQFRKLVKDVKSEQVSRVSFNRLDIVVDKRKLMPEGSVPIGLVRFFFDTFVRCGIGRSHPFLTCCAESIMGSWTPCFLWLKLKTGTSDCNRGCREICSWSTIFNSLGGLVLMAIIPLPYYLRLIEFYLFERDELIDRRAAMDNWKWSIRQVRSCSNFCRQTARSSPELSMPRSPYPSCLYSAYDA